MMHVNPINFLLLLLSGILSVFGYVVPHTNNQSPSRLSEYLPVVIWHGLGDTYNSSGIASLASEMQAEFPGIVVYSVYIEEDEAADRKASWFGNVNDQVELVAKQLQAIPVLSQGFNALGISQGGQFLRAYNERFNDPPVYNLITFGSQHMGISKTADCEPGDLLCLSVQSIIKFGVYSSWIQNSVVPAQYFRDSSQIEKYLDSSNFLADINNERPLSRNPTYAKNLASLNKLVLVLFTEDATVIPKESSWFGSYAPPDNSVGLVAEEPVIIPLRQQPLYTEDWIGLKKLDSEDRIKFIACEGGHLHYSECFASVIKEYAGVLSPSYFPQRDRLIVQ